MVMQAFGWTIASLGAIGLCSSVIMEIIKKEPIYMLTMKLSAGILGIGGVLLGITALGA